MPDLIEGLQNLQPLFLGGIPIAVIIYLAVEAGLILGLVKNETDSKRRATVVVAIVLAGVWTLRVLSLGESPLTIALVIDTLFVALVGALAAALIHEVVSRAAAALRREPQPPIQL